jgi:NAD-dependent SIR2 family protein deacetylase
MADDIIRRRYWARSMIGWRRFGRAQPNDAHHALAKLEAKGQCQLLLSQNVDRLHQAAGSRAVIDLHGRLDLIRCMACSATSRRADFQDDLIRHNAAWTELDAGALPDGDADLSQMDFSTFAVPPCAFCGGVLKPDVVFYGETVQRDQVAAAQTHLESADAMLIVGSSLMVYSGFRFAQAADQFSNERVVDIEIDEADFSGRGNQTDSWAVDTQSEADKSPENLLYDHDQTNHR